MTTGQRASILTICGALTLASLPRAAAAQAADIAQARKAMLDNGRTAASIGVHGFSVVLVVGGTIAQIDELESQLAALRTRYNDRHPRLVQLQHEITQARADLSAAKVRGASASDNMPEAARKALADMKDFLPYKRYQLLDAAWILCCGTENNGVSGRVRGPDGRDYQYILDPSGVVSSKLNLRFTMREVQELPLSPVSVDKLSDTARLEYMRQQAEAARELAEAELQVRTIRPRVEVGTATPYEMEAATIRARSAQQRVQDLQRIGGGGGGQARGTATASAGGRGGGGARGGTTFGREIMDSSFSISPGETVVIGTSRINGDQALIAILTAATKPGGAR